MKLADFGNTTVALYDTTTDKLIKKDVKSFDPSFFHETTYYISVNQQISKKLQSFSNWINLEAYIDRAKYYETMGIDRIMACEAIENGVIVDAGSAITVDVMRDGEFEGGFIYPGIKAMQTCYKNISPVLDYAFNFSVTTLAKSSADAISYGYLIPFVKEVQSYNLPIVLTGGDATKLQTLFGDHVRVDEKLIFSGMYKILDKKVDKLQLKK